MTSTRIPERKDIKKQDQWDLGQMYNNQNQWEADLKSIESQVSRYQDFKGHLGESIDVFREAWDFDLELSRTMEKVYTYAHLKSDQDKGNQENLALLQRCVTLYTKMSELSSYMTPEIQSLPEKTIQAYMDHESMSEARFSLEKIARYKPHTRSHEVEEVMAMMGEVSGTASQVFSQLDNVDIDFGSMEDEKGQEKELSHGNFSLFLKSPDRDVRESAFKQYYRSYENHRNTIATTLAGSIKKDWFYARTRKFDSCRQAALFSDNVPEDVYDNLLSTIRDNFDPLFDYFRLRQEMLGVDELHFYDTYVPLVKDVEFRLDYEQAVDICTHALQPLGEEYTSTLKDGLLNGWVDRYENQGKRSGAYSSGCYDSPPYILLNFEKDDLNSLYTMIHEAGHSMHSWLSIRNQPYINHGYTIFVAEVASTFNETLLSRYLLEKYRDDPVMTAYILNREIDNLRSTLYRQTMFAEFEKITHHAVEDETPLTLDFMTSSYRGLLQDYFGETMVIDDELQLECLRIPHFYSAFYVYKYATGISAAIALARGVMEGDAEKRDAYMKFLGLGGSMFPIDELKVAGVDMSTPGPVKEACTYFGSLVERLRQTL